VTFGGRIDGDLHQRFRTRTDDRGQHSTSGLLAGLRVSSRNLGDSLSAHAE
jgi:hypothetical protein